MQHLKKLFYSQFETTVHVLVDISRSCISLIQRIKVFFQSAKSISIHDNSFFMRRFVQGRWHEFDFHWYMRYIESWKHEIHLDENLPIPIFFYSISSANYDEIQSRVANHYLILSAIFSSKSEQSDVHKCLFIIGHINFVTNEEYK